MNLNAEALHCNGQKGRGRHHTDQRTHLSEELNIRSSYAAVQNVAANRDCQSVQVAQAPADGERIKERLQEWKKASNEGRIGSMLLGAGQVEAMEIIAGEML